MKTEAKHFGLAVGP